MKTIKTLSLVVLLLFAIACKKNTKTIERPQGGAFVEELYSALSGAVVRDQFSPPVAARVNAYVYIAAYEAAVPFYEGYESLEGKLTGLEGVPKPENAEELDSIVAIFAAYTTTGYNFTYKNRKLQEYQKQQIEEFKAKLGEEKVEKSLAYGKAVAEAILKWSKSDNYVAIRAAPKYKPKFDSRAHWLPTYPDYAHALCPKWNDLRPMLLDSATQFMIEPPTQFDSTEGSDFYKENIEVYNVSKEVDSTKKFIAHFWDDNPSVAHHYGHLGFSELKLTPGGHWMGIAAAACRRESKSLIESIWIQTKAAIAIYDGFIVCWDEKFRSDYIRPITYIRRYIDKDWISFLTTPNFPEYPSGHSVVSGSASTILEDAFGKQYPFIDSTELEYLHGIRSFNSFKEAADEAAISRMYGGIHFVPAIENGVEMGRNVGDFVLKEID